MKVTTEGERVIDLLWDVIAAKGFEKDTYFEMAARDIRALPKLEGTVHVNMALVLKFMANYPYVVDFVCLGSRLVIEVDGPIHAEGSRVACDSMRNSFLREQGFRVLRLNNEDVLLRRAEVVSSVNAALAGATPTPGPSRCSDRRHREHLCGDIANTF